jgi:iron complex outermembrane recepter protein
MIRLPFRTSHLAIASAMALGAYAAPVAAQDVPNIPAEEDAAAEDGGIVVTARRREENLVDVPIAVTAYSGEALEQAGAIDITDIGQTTPNTTLEASRGTNSTLTAFIRGVGQQDPVSGFEQGVGIYLDDVYLNRPQGAVLDIYDVERIEVLRGPQGTLYGRNTIGGAVKYVTRMLPQDPSFKARATYGTYNQLDGVISGSAPIGDIVRVGAAVARLTRDGFGKNLTTGEENYNKDVWGARGTFEMGGYGAPVLIRISGDYTKDESNARGGHRLIPGAFSGAPVLADVFDTRGGLVDPVQDVEGYGLAMNVSVELSDALTLRSISAWREDKSFSPIDFDALPAVDVDVPAFYGNEQISQELQLLYDAGPLSVLIGGYYLDAKADTSFEVRLFTSNPALPGLTAFTQANVDTETYAVFGDATFDISDQLSVSVGGRYTWDTRFADILRQNYLFGPTPFFGGNGTILGTPSTDFTGEREFRKFTPRASVSFKPAPGHNLYASYSQGFKGGGFDPRGVGVNAPDLDKNGVRSDAEIAQFLSFAPEQVDSYELGYKGSLLGDALYVALAGFYADYTDVQIPGSVGCVVGGVATFCGVVSNAGKATFKGLEFETTARLGRDLMAAGDRLTLSGALGYIDAQYDEYITNIASTPTNVAEFREVQNTPKWTASGTLGYSTPVGAGELDFTSTLSYRSKTFQFEVPNPYLDQPGFALLDANLVYSAPDDRWTIGLHGRNLTDKRYKTSGYPFVVSDPKTGAIPLGSNGFPTPSLGREGALTAFYGNPRQVFVTGTVKF